LSEGVVRLVREDVEVIDLYLRPIKNKTLFVPLTDPLMILYASVDYITRRLNLKPRYYFKIPGMPPMMFSVDGAVAHPIVILGAEGCPLMLLRVPPRYGDTRKLYELIAEKLVRWAARNEFDRIVVADVKPARGDKPEVFFITEEKLVESVAKYGFKPFTGVFTSEAAYFMDECLRSKIDGIMLVVESVAMKRLSELFKPQVSQSIIHEIIEDLAKHDEKAVGMVIEALSKISGVDIPLDDLPKFMDEIRESLRTSIQSLLRMLHTEKVGLERLII